MDVIGLVILKASNSHEYILVAIDYFTKWVEGASYKSVTQAVVARFLKHNIIFLVVHLIFIFFYVKKKKKKKMEKNKQQENM